MRKSPKRESAPRWKVSTSTSASTTRPSARIPKTRSAEPSASLQDDHSSWIFPSRKSSLPHLFPFSCVVLQLNDSFMKWKSHLKTSVTLSKLRCLAPTHLIGSVYLPNDIDLSILKIFEKIMTCEVMIKYNESWRYINRSKVLSMAVSKYSR